MSSPDDEVLSLSSTAAGVEESSIHGAVLSLNFLVNPAPPPDADDNDERDVPANS